MRLDSFNDYRKPHMARGDFMLGGMAVVISPNLPRKHVGDQVIPVMPSKPVQFLLRLLRRPIVAYRFRQGAKIEEEQAVQMQGKLFMSPAMWASLSKRISS